MDLNTILIILGVVALVALVAHGIWSNRREKSQIFEKSNSFSKESAPRQPEHNAANFATREPMAQPAQSFTQQPEPISSTQQNLDFNQNQPVYFEQTQVQEPQNFEQAINQIKISLPNEPLPVQASVEPAVSYSSPQHLANATIAEIESTVNTEEGIHAEHQLTEVLATPTENVIQIERERPIVEFEEVQQNVSVQPAEKEEPQHQDQGAKDFIMLYVVSPEGKEFHGLSLEKAFDSLGFIFGNRQIYHRHVDLNVASPVLFSAANIQQPGTFDPNNMADFYTVGIALFMQLPSHGNDLVNLRMMIRAAKTLAEELGGFVLTDQQEIFDDNAEKAYLAKVSA
ncbi:cell division protein ZipA [Avibacterium avium]|uniref:cell division protein ZipA n=1 Tax=Avibacterium avium TaxID=751 RepID=UPI003BF8768D